MPDFKRTEQAMPAPINTSAAPDATPASLAATLQSRVSSYVDICLLAACLLSATIFYGLLVSPALATVRRTYLELGIGAQLACAASFVGGMILVLLTLFWSMVNIVVAVQARPKRLARESHAALAQELFEAQRQAEALYVHMLADMRREGGSAQDIAQARALIDAVSKKVGLDGQRRIAEYEKNPAALEKEIRGTVARLESGEVLEGGFKRV